MRTLTDYEYPVLAMDAYNRGQDPPTSTGPTISNVGREMNQGDLPRGPMLVLRQNLPAVTLRPRCRRSVREPAAFASGAKRTSSCRQDDRTSKNILVLSFADLEVSRETPDRGAPRRLMSE